LKKTPIDDKTQSLAFLSPAARRPFQAAGALKRLEILHTTIRGVCPSCMASSGSPIQLHAATPGSFPTAPLPVQGTLKCSELFKLVASRLGSSA
jgi:hypothetical protein